MSTPEHTSSGRSATIAVALAGTVLVFLYAALASAQILALNPLAAVPELSLEQIWARIDAVYGTSSVAFMAVALGLGAGLAILVLVLLARRRDATPLAAAFAYLAMLALGAPAVFIASFPVSLDLADTFLVGGAPYAPWTYLLYAVSGVAALGALALAIVTARRQHPQAAVAT